MCIGCGNGISYWQAGTATARPEISLWRVVCTAEQNTAKCISASSSQRTVQFLIYCEVALCINSSSRAI